MNKGNEVLKDPLHMDLGVRFRKCCVQRQHNSEAERKDDSACSYKIDMDARVGNLRGSFCTESNGKADHGSKQSDGKGIEDGVSNLVVNDCDKRRKQTDYSVDR